LGDHPLGQPWREMVGVVSSGNYGDAPGAVDGFVAVGLAVAVG
jgi:hypothetical protein